MGIFNFPLVTQVLLILLRAESVRIQSKTMTIIWSERLQCKNSLKSYKMNCKGQKEDSNTEFLKFSAVGIWGWIISCCGGCPVHRRMFSSIAGVSSLDANRTQTLVAQTVKNPPAMWGTWVRSLGWEDPLEEGMATRESPRTEEPGGLHSMESQRVRHHWVTQHPAPRHRHAPWMVTTQNPTPLLGLLSEGAQWNWWCGC